jgi:hypothetical protein
LLVDGQVASVHTTIAAAVEAREALERKLKAT